MMMARIVLVSTLLNQMPPFTFMHIPSMLCDVDQIPRISEFNCLIHYYFPFPLIGPNTEHLPSLWHRHQRFRWRLSLVPIQLLRLNNTSTRYESNYIRVQWAANGVNSVCCLPLPCLAAKWFLRYIEYLDS